MEYKKEGTDDTPFVYFSKSENILTIQGNSLPEEVTEFYTPIIEKLDAYLADPNPVSQFVFKMFYFNSASSKIIFTIVELLNEAFKRGTNIGIKWMYEMDDDDMLDAGKSMEDYVEIPIEYEGFMEME